MIYRNKKLLALARVAPKCFCCGSDNDGTVVAAHSNMQIMGKGMGIKSADLPAYVCYSCHDHIDGRKTQNHLGTGRAEWCEAAVASLRWALENHPEVFK